MSSDLRTKNAPPRRKRLRQTLRAAVFRALPQPLAHRIIRNTLNLAIPRANSGLSFEIASNTIDLKAALGLLQKNFEREGYTRQTRSGLRLTPYHLLPQTVVIVAKHQDRVIATISVIPRTGFGVPLDGSFSIDAFLADKGKVVEVSALAVDPEFRGQFGEVLYNLMKFMYHVNVGLLGAEMEVIGVNPKMVPLYEAILLFRRIPETRREAYDFANGAPVVPMYFSLRRSHEQFEAVYAHKPSHLNLMEFFLLPPPVQYSLPKPEEIETLLPQLRPRDLRDILAWEPDLLSDLNERQRQVLMEAYKLHPECAKILRERVAL